MSSPLEKADVDNYPESHGGTCYNNTFRSNWVPIHYAPNAVDSDGVVSSKLVSPFGIDDANVVRLGLRNMGTTLLLALKYDAGISTVTDPVVRAFGICGCGNDLYPIVLEDAAGETEHTLATDLTLDTVFDIGGTDYSITQPIKLELNGANEVIVGVQTALAATGTVSTAEILAKVI